MGIVFKVGDKVMLSPKSDFYGKGGRQLPNGVLGTVVIAYKFADPDAFSVRVNWKDMSQIYRKMDLIPYEEYTNDGDLSEWA